MYIMDAQTHSCVNINEASVFNYIHTTYLATCYIQTNTIIGTYTVNVYYNNNLN